MDGSRFALVVANDQYADPGLRRLVAPAQDAAALAEALADPSVGGFKVKVMQNESAQAIRFAVEDFFADRAPEDLLLLHFSCHGLKNAAGELFLAVADTKPNRLASTALAADFVNRQMADSRAQRIALFLDCCYGGAFPRGMVVRASGEAQVRDAFAEQEGVGGGRGRVVVTASSAMEYAFEGGLLATDASKPTPSVFTGAVVDGLMTGEADRDGDGWVGLTELVAYVTDRVHRAVPNQNPQMWTFGAQGELLIARSRVRRITPTRLAPELLEAMESPLSAARFGVVDYLRERLHGADLGQAYAAWQALQRMTDDDSRKVSEAAHRAMAEAVPRVTPENVDLGTLGQAGASAELRLHGPPIALTAAASAGAPWIRVEQDDAVVRVSAESPGPGEHMASLILAGPTGQRTIPVRVRVPDVKVVPDLETVPGVVAKPEHEPVPDRELHPEPEPPERPAALLPESTLTPAAVSAASIAEPITPAKAEHLREQTPQPPDAQPVAADLAPSQPAAAEQAPAQPPVSEKAATGGAVSWWVVALMAMGALALIILNWPGPTYSRKIWSDESMTGWRVYRSWHDPEILSSVVVFVASLALRWSGRLAPVALGVVAGGALSIVEDGLLILASDIAGEEVAVWIAATAIAAGVAAVVLLTLRPRSWPLRPVRLPAAGLAIAGGVLLLLSATIKTDGVSFLMVTKLAAMEPIVTVALAWLALAAVETSSRLWLSATAITYALVSMVAIIPALTDGGSSSTFVTGLVGNALVVAGIALAARQPVRPGTGQTGR
jgi:uncharacterized caspase-like protein